MSISASKRMYLRARFFNRQKPMFSCKWAVIFKRFQWISPILFLALHQQLFEQWLAWQVRWEHYRFRNEKKTIFRGNKFHWFRQQRYKKRKKSIRNHCSMQNHLKTQIFGLLKVDYLCSKFKWNEYFLFFCWI